MMCTGIYLKKKNVISRYNVTSCIEQHFYLCSKIMNACVVHSDNLHRFVTIIFNDCIST